MRGREYASAPKHPSPRGLPVGEGAQARALAHNTSPCQPGSRAGVHEKVGSFGHLVMIGRSGFMTHAEAEKGFTRFAKEVLRRLRKVAPVTVD